MAEFTHSEHLFVNENDEAIKFSMRPCEEKAKLKPLIEHGGGILTSKSTTDSIRLAEPGSKVLSDNCVSSSYVWDCVKLNALLSLRDYKTEQTIVEDSDISDDDFNTTIRVPERKTRGRREYMMADSQAIIDFIGKHHRYADVKGRTLWIGMEKLQVLEGRTWQSMKEHFLKKILPNIRSYVVSEEEYRKFARPFSNEQIAFKLEMSDDECIESGSDATSKQDDEIASLASVGRGQKYTKTEDLKMITFLLEDRYRLDELKGNVLWKDMESQKVTSHTWQSMKERFNKRIIPALETYDVPKKYRSSFTKLKDKLSPRAATSERTVVDQSKTKTRSSVKKTSPDVSLHQSGSAYKRRKQEKVTDEDDLEAGASFSSDVRTISSQNVASQRTPVEQKRKDVKDGGSDLEKEVVKVGEVVTTVGLVGDTKASDNSSVNIEDENSVKVKTTVNNEISNKILNGTQNDQSPIALPTVPDHSSSNLPQQVESVTENGLMPGNLDEPVMNHRATDERRVIDEPKINGPTRTSPRSVRTSPPPIKRRSKDAVHTKVNNSTEGQGKLSHESQRRANHDNTSLSTDLDGSYIGSNETARRLAKPLKVVKITSVLDNSTDTQDSECRSEASESLLTGFDTDSNPANRSSLALSHIDSIQVHKKRNFRDPLNGVAVTSPSPPKSSPRNNVTLEKRDSELSSNLSLEDSNPRKRLLRAKKKSSTSKFPVKRKISSSPTESSVKRVRTSEVLSNDSSSLIELVPKSRKEELLKIYTSLPKNGQRLSVKQEADLIKLLQLFLSLTENEVCVLLKAEDYCVTRVIHKVFNL